MGKGGSSNSTNTTTTTNVSGTNAVSGDNLGVLLSGVNGSTVNIKATDHGAVRAAATVTTKALDSNVAAIKEANELSREAVKTNESVTKAAMASNENAIEKALIFGRDSMAANSEVNLRSLNNMRKSSEEAISVVKSMAEQSGTSARAAIAMAEETASRSQTGSASDMRKVTIAVAIVLGLAVTVVALKESS